MLPWGWVGGAEGELWVTERLLPANALDWRWVRSALRSDNQASDHCPLAVVISGPAGSLHFHPVGVSIALFFVLDKREVLGRAASLLPAAGFLQGALGGLVHCSEGQEAPSTEAGAPLARPRMVSMETAGLQCHQGGLQ